MGTQPSGENLCEDLIARHALSTTKTKKEENNRKERERQDRLYPECKNALSTSSVFFSLCLSISPLILKSFFNFPFSFRMCLTQRSLAWLHNVLTDSRQSVYGWLHFAISCHNAPPAVHHPCPKTIQNPCVYVCVFVCAQFKSWRVLTIWKAHNSAEQCYALNVIIKTGLREGYIYQWRMENISLKTIEFYEMSL